MGTQTQPHHAMLWLLQPGVRPVEAVIWAGGRTLKVPLIPLAKPESFPEGPAREAVTTLLQQRAELLTHWGARPLAAAGFQGARALKVSPLSGRRWCFELPGGVVIACPPGFILGLERTQVAQPVALEGGRWWLWPDAPLVVDVGHTLAALPDGEAQVAPLPCGPLTLGATAAAVPTKAQAAPPVERIVAASETPPMEVPQTPPPVEVASAPVPAPAPPEETEPAAAATPPEPAPEATAVPPAASEPEPVTSPEETAAPPSKPPRPLPTAKGASNPDEPKVDRRTRVQAGSVQGMILLHGEFIDEDELVRINEEQRKRKEAGQTVALGQVALELGMVTPDQLRFVMTLSRRLTVKGDAPKPLALFLLEHNVIRPVPLNHALERAAENNAPIESVLLEMNLINEAALKTFVDIHARFSMRST